MLKNLGLVEALDGFSWVLTNMATAHVHRGHRSLARHEQIIYCPILIQY